MTQIFYFFTHPDAKIKLLTLELKPPFQFFWSAIFLGSDINGSECLFCLLRFSQKK